MDGREAYLSALGRNIRKARLTAGITQRELAQRAGYPVWKISRAERGACGVSVQMAARLARAMDCRLCELMKGI